MDVDVGGLRRGTVAGAVGEGLRDVERLIEADGLRLVFHLIDKQVRGHVSGYGRFGRVVLREFRIRASVEGDEFFEGGVAFKNRYP